MVDLCPICSYEHLLKSATYLNEAKGSEADTPRYKDKVRDAVRELFAAQEHDPDPEFAAKIRKFRLDRVEAPLFGGKMDTGQVLADLQDLIDEAEQDLPQEESAAEAHKSYHKGGGHSKQYGPGDEAHELHEAVAGTPDSCEQELQECMTDLKDIEECRKIVKCP